MKTNLMKISLVLAIALLCTNASKAQTKEQTGTKTHHNSYSNNSTVDGKHVEHIQTNWDGDVYYDVTFTDDKLTKLKIDGKEIPQTDWGKYSDVIDQLREQMKRDRAQAKRDQEQAGRDQEQAKRDQEQAARDQQQAKRDQEHAGREQMQAKKDQEQAARDQEQAKRDQEQAQRDQLQAKRDQEQAGRDQEQAKLDQLQAKKDQEQALEDQRLMKQMLSDLVVDKIVPNENSIETITLNEEEMTVNGKKQPDEVYKKYRARFSRFVNLNFSYGNSDGVHTYRGIHMSKRSN